MSYILSALKKAEQERRSGDTPDVLTPQAGQEPAPSSAGHGSRPYLVAGIAAALLCGLWLVNAWRSGDAPIAVHDDPPGRQSGFVDEPGNGHDGDPATARRDAPSAAPPLVQYGDFSGDEPGFGAPPVGRAATMSPPAVEWEGSGDEIPDIAELPPPLRRHLPQLTLTGHLYSLAHRNARKVILNGVALKEKQYLNDELMVSEITPDGVILDFQGWLFRINADQMFR